jgi:hypothetical protein
LISSPDFTERRCPLPLSFKLINRSSTWKTDVGNLHSFEVTIGGLARCVKGKMPFAEGHSKRFKVHGIRYKVKL